MTDGLPGNEIGTARGLRVRAANSSDFVLIADVHLAAFPEFFLAQLGRPFLTEYYRTVLRYSDGILLVAEQNGSVVGFAAGFVDPRSFYRFMSQRKWHFAIPACWGVLRHPRLLRRLYARKRRVVAGDELPQSEYRTICELSSLAVKPGNGGKGLGRLLVYEFVKEAAKRGAESVFLTTDAVHNETVNHFYQRLGFQLSRRFKLDGTREMNEYFVSVDTLSSAHCRPTGDRK